ncbi:FKBP12-associated protein [Marasmius sp. AFHP31]|nr:FKBP12-associated protein [Marasmius sp. AFHP31]
MASFAAPVKGKGKKKVGMNEDALDEALKALHECDLVCGKTLTCGNHQCEERDHKGPCKPCLRSSFEELICSWDVDFIVVIAFVTPVIVEIVHRCAEKLGSYACLNNTLAPLFVTLPLSVLKTNRSTSSPNGLSRLQPKCTSECGIAQRNARLADALGIKADARSNTGNEATYSDDLVGFARANMKFLGLVETAFTEFVNSPKRTQVLPHMPPDRRKFVHDLAHVYRLDTQMVDQEPHRSVQIIRRVDTRIPHPLLSAHIASLAPSAPSLGKLGNLRGGTVSAPSWRKANASTVSNPNVAAPTATTPLSSTRGWTSVVARPTPPTNARPTGSSTSANPSANPSRTGTPDRAATSTPRTGVATNANSVALVPPSVPNPGAVDVPDDWEDDA